MKFKPNRDLPDDLAKQREFREGLAEAAEEARDHAETFADAAGGPWMPRRGTSSATQIVIDTSGDVVRLVNTDHAGHLLEWGSANNPPHAPLRRGVRAAGLRLDEQ